MDTKKVLTNKITVIPLVIMISILWGSAFPAIKLIYRELGVETISVPARIFLASLRFLVASAILLILSAITLRKKIFVKKQYIPRLILLGIFQTVLQYLFLYIGMANSTGTKGAVLTSTLNFFLVIICHFYYKNDRLNFKKIMGLVLGFSGIVLANWEKGFNWGFKMNGEFMLIMVGLVSAIGYLIAKELSRDVNPLVVTTWQMIIGSLTLLLIGGILMNPGDIAYITPRGWGIIVYTGLLSSIVFPLWYSVLKYNKAGEITIYKFIIPISGTLISAWIVPGEIIPSIMPIALLLVASGIIVVNSRKSNPKKEVIYDPSHRSR